MFSRFIHVFACMITSLPFFCQIVFKCMIIPNTMVYLFIYWLKDNLCFSTCWLLWIKLLWTFVQVCFFFFFWAPAFTSFEFLPRSEIPGSCGTSLFNFLWNCQTSRYQLYHFTFILARYEGLLCSFWIHFLTSSDGLKVILFKPHSA